LPIEFSRTTFHQRPIDSTTTVINKKGIKYPDILFLFCIKKVIAKINAIISKINE
jgi:hypothetical protein